MSDGGTGYQKYLANQQKESTGDISKLPPAPDLTDQALQKKRSSAMMLAGAGRGRRSTFIASAMGEPLLGKTLLGGY